MKKSIAVLALGLAIAGCQQSEQPKKVDDKKASTTEQKTVIAEKDKIAYAIGADMARSVESINSTFKSMNVDLKVVQQGFADTLSQKSIMTPEETTQQIQIFQQKLRFAQQQQMQEEKAAKEAENAAHFASLEGKGYTKTESGLHYKVLKEAPKNAKKPSATDRVRVHYTGTLTDGTQFDSSVGRTPFEFSLEGGVIQGWLEGVKMMPVGSKYQFVIPANLAYGGRAAGAIPPHSILNFDVELLEIVKPETTKK